MAVKPDQNFGIFSSLGPFVSISKGNRRYKGIFSETVSLL